MTNSQYLNIAIEERIKELGSNNYGGYLDEISPYFMRCAH